MKYPRLTGALVAVLAIAIGFILTACLLGSRPEVQIQPGVIPCSPPEQNSRYFMNPTKESFVTTTVSHGDDDCDYTLARNGEIAKVPGSCPEAK